MTRFAFSLSAILTASLGLAGAVRAAEPFDAFLENHCISCHGPKKEKGDLRIDPLARFQVGRGHASLGGDDRTGQLGRDASEEGEETDAGGNRGVCRESRLLDQGGPGGADGGAAGGGAYRLSRKEYQNTVYDLLGVRYDPAKPGELNEDTLWHGFERIGSELSLSPSHVDRYYRAAELALDRAFPAASGEARKVRKTAAELRYGGGTAFSLHQTCVVRR